MSKNVNFRFNSILLLCLLAVQSISGALVREKSRHIKDYPERIVGGEVAERGQFPYQVQLQFIGTHYCGGAVLNENWIVTAGKQENIILF